MKQILSMLLILSLSLSALAQEKQFNDITSYSYEGVKTFDGKLYYLIQYGKPTKEAPYNYTVQLFDAQFNRLASDMLPVKYLGSVASVTEHRGGIMLYVKSGKEGRLVSYSAQGKKELDVPYTMEKSDFNDLILASLGDRGFVMIRPAKEKQDGFSVSCYDLQGQQTWTKSHYPEKGNLKWKGVQVQGNYLAVYSQFTKSAFSTVFEDKLWLYNTSDGNLLSEQFITNDIENGMTKSFLLNADGSTLATGITIMKNKEGKIETAGVFFKSYSADGQLIFDRKITAAELTNQGYLTDLSSRYAKRTPALRFQQISKTAAGYQIIAEQYSWDQLPAPPAQPGAPPALTSPGNLYILDYAVFQLGNDGSLRELQMIGKPHKMIQLEGFSIFEEVKADDTFSGLNFFAFSHYDEAGKRIVEYNWSNNQRYIAFIPVLAGHENILERIYLPGIVNNAPLSNDLTTKKLKKEGLNTPLDPFKTAILPHSTANQLTYVELLDEKSLLFKTFPMKAEAPQLVNNQIVLPGIQLPSFEGLFPVGDRGYFSLNLAEPAANKINMYLYQQFKNDLSLSARSVLKVPNTAILLGEVDKGQSMILVFRNRENGDWVMYELDVNGKLVDQNVVKEETQPLYNDIYYASLKAAEGGFFATVPIYNYKQNSSGYRIVRFDENRKISWTGTYLPGKDEVVELINSDAGNGMVALIHGLRSRNWYEGITNSMLILDDADGKILSETNLFDGSDTPFPETVKIAGSDAICSGAFFKGTRFDGKNSDGIFYVRVSKTGEKKAYEKVFWSTLEEKLNVKTGDFLVSGKEKVFIQDMIVDAAGNCTLIGELFRKSAGTTTLGYLMGDDASDRAFSVYDFVIMEFKNNQFQSIYRLPKAEQNILIQGSTGHMQGLSLSYLMKEYRVFSYLGVRKMNNENHIFYRNNVDNKEYMFHTKLATNALALGQTSIDPPVIPPPTQEIPQEFAGLQRLADKMNALDAKLQVVGNALQKAMTGTNMTLSFNRDYTKGYEISDLSGPVIWFFHPYSGQLILEKRKMQ
jgi:hypothetical protein